MVFLHLYFYVSRKESANNVYECEEKPKSFGGKVKEDLKESFPTAMCSPPMSVTEEDEDMPYSLMPQYTRNSSPLFFSNDEVRNIASYGRGTHVY